MPGLKGSKWGERKTPRNVLIDQDDIDRLEIIAKKRNISISELIRQSIKIYLENRGSK